ncbi:hypothetical protein ABTU92_26730, partial [Rhodoplanes sp. SY1]
MSAPIDDDGSTVPLRYAPPWARRGLERGDETAPEARDAEPTVVPDPPEPPAFLESAEDEDTAPPIAEATPHREPEVILGVPFGDVAAHEPQDHAPADLAPAVHAPPDHGPQDLDVLAAPVAGPMPPAATA